MAKIQGSAGRNRAIYNDLPKNATQGYLRLEKSLGTQSTVEFDVLNNVGTPNTTERRLKITDRFWVSELAIFLFKLPSGGNLGATNLDSWPNAGVYTAANEAINLHNIYNGYLAVRVNQTVWIDSLDVYRFYRVGGAQEGVGLSTYDATNNPINKFVNSTWDIGSFGFIPNTPLIALDGLADNKITITCPQSLAMAGTSSTNYVVCYLRGFLQQNGATGK